MQQNRGFARGWRALEGWVSDPNDSVPFGEGGEDLAQFCRARYRVVFVATFNETRRGGRIIIRTEGHNDDIGVECCTIGCDVLSQRVNRGDGSLMEAHTGLDNVLIVSPHSIRL